VLNRWQSCFAAIEAPVEASIDARDIVPDAEPRFASRHRQAYVDDRDTSQNRWRWSNVALAAAIPFHHTVVKNN
jgi:anti-sigma-K factor RskA